MKQFTRSKLLGALLLINLLTLNAQAKVWDVVVDVVKDVVVDVVEIVEDAAEKLAREAGEQKQKIDDKWNRVREKTLDELGDNIAKELESLDDKIDQAFKDIDEAFYKANKVLARVLDPAKPIFNPPRYIENPDMEMKLSSKLIEGSLNKVFKEKYPLGSGTNFLQIERIDARLVNADADKPNHNIIVLNIKKGKLWLKDHCEQKPCEIKSATLSLAPMVNETILPEGNTTRYIDFNATLNRIVVESNGVELAGYLNLIIRSYAGEALARKPLLSINVNNFIEEQKKYVLFGSEKTTNIHVDDVGLNIKDNTLQIAVRFKDKEIKHD